MTVYTRNPGRGFPPKSKVAACLKLRLWHEEAKKNKMSVHKAHVLPTPPPPHFSTTPLTTENGRGARFVSPTAMQELKARGGILQGAVNGNGSSAMPQQPAMKRRTRALETTAPFPRSRRSRSERAEVASAEFSTGSARALTSSHCG